MVVNSYSQLRGAQRKWTEEQSQKGATNKHI